MSKVELFENQRASNYNTFVETWIPNYHFFLEKLPKLLHQTEEKKLLVVGCGTGNEIEYFTNHSKEWEITGIDPSPDMLQQAHLKFKNTKNVSLIKGGVSDLDPSDKFNAATLLLVLHFLEDNGEKLNLLKSIADRLKSNASLILLDITGTKSEIKENLKILKHLLPDVLNEKEVEERLHRIENKLHHVSEERLKELLKEAGFKTPLRFFQSSIYMGWITSKI